MFNFLRIIKFLQFFVGCFAVSNIWISFVLENRMSFREKYSVTIRIETNKKRVVVKKLNSIRRRIENLPQFAASFLFCDCLRLFVFETALAKRSFFCLLHIF